MIDDVITHGTRRHLGKKILLDSNRHESAMTQNGRKRCFGIVTFDLGVYFPPITLLYYTGILAFMRKRLMLALK